MSPVLCKELDIGEEATVGNRVPPYDFAGVCVELWYLEGVGIGMRGSHLLENCDVCPVRMHSKAEEKRVRRWGSSKAHTRSFILGYG
jgi:hypothetical protein